MTVTTIAPVATAMTAIIIERDSKTRDIINATNLFHTATDAVVVPVNAEGNVKAGYTLKEFAYRLQKTTYAAAYQRACQIGALKAGTMRLWKSPQGKRWIVNACTVDTAYKQSDLAYIEPILKGLREKLVAGTFTDKTGVEHAFTSIALPVLGTGSGRMRAQDVLPLYMKYFSNLPEGRRVLVYIEAGMEQYLPGVPVTPTSKQKKQTVEAAKEERAQTAETTQQERKQLWEQRKQEIAAAKEERARTRQRRNVKPAPVATPLSYTLKLNPKMVQLLSLY